MTKSGRAATEKVAHTFIDSTFPWLPKPKVIEWDNTAGGSQYYATDKTISVPKYSDAWNDGRYDIVIHEVGHVVVYYCATFGEVLTPFLAAMHADQALRQHPLINEIIAEHFARAYVPGYTGANRPELVGLVPFEVVQTRAFFQSLHKWPDIVLFPLSKPTATGMITPSVAATTTMPTALLRYCYDSTNAKDIPAGAAIVAGYIDGLYEWSDADWALHPSSVKVRIACFSDTNDGHVGDVERGDMTPAGGVAWVQMRRAAGIDPTVYTGLGQWDAVRAAFENAGVKEPHYWIAHYDNDPTPIPGAFAKQYANPTWTGKHYDVSVVTGRWPGVEEDDVAFKDDPDAQAFAKDVKDSLDAIKAVLTTQAHHKHDAATTTSEPK